MDTGNGSSVLQTKILSEILWQMDEVMKWKVLLTCCQKHGFESSPDSSSSPMNLNKFLSVSECEFINL